MAKETKAKEKIIAFYRLLAERIINFKGELSVTAEELTNTLIVTVECHADDHGKLIGSKGVTFNALKSLTKMAGARMGKNVHLTQEKPKVGERLPLTPFTPDTSWDSQKRTEEMRLMLVEVCKTIFRQPFEVEAVDNHDNTYYAILLSPVEQTALPLDVIDRDMEIVFHAIGKAVGRKVFVELSKL